MAIVGSSAAWRLVLCCTQPPETLVTIWSTEMPTVQAPTFLWKWGSWMFVSLSKFDGFLVMSGSSKVSIWTSFFLKYRFHCYLNYWMMLAKYIWMLLYSWHTIRISFIEIFNQLVKLWATMTRVFVVARSATQLSTFKCCSSVLAVSTGWILLIFETAQGLDLRVWNTCHSL